MAGTLENRLDMLTREIKEIKKEVILQRLKKTTATINAASRWRTLGGRVSKKWDHIPAMEEIASQRDKGL